MDRSCKFERIVSKKTQGNLTFYVTALTECVHLMFSRTFL